jgi:hypothetical protein
MDPDAGAALGEACRSPGERGEIHSSAHQRVVERDDADSALDVRIELRQSVGQGLHIASIGADRCMLWAKCVTDGG